jgi:hypothetical protein
VKEHSSNAETGQQSETAPGTSQPDRPAGLARRSQEVLSSAGAQSGGESDERQAGVMQTAEPRVKEPVRVTIDNPPRIPDGFEPKQSPIFDIMRHLATQNLALAEQLEHKRKQQRDNEMRYQKNLAERDPEKARTNWREAKRRYREKKKQAKAS